MKVKGNCRSLHAACLEHVAAAEPLEVHESEERTRGRTVRRRVSVYAAPAALPGGWPAVGRVLHVERSGERRRPGEPAVSPYARSGVYVTSRTDSAAALAAAVQGHWGIENGLHWSKDVEQGEDGGGVRSFGGAWVLSVLRGLVLSVYRWCGWTATEGRAWLSNRVGRMLRILRT